MNTQELQEKINFKWVGYGTFEITIKYHNNEWSCKSHNTLATDRISMKEDIPAKEIQCSYTLKQAYQALYEECKRKNNIGEYRNDFRAPW